jgi:hypothetical protein
MIANAPAHLQRNAYAASPSTDSNLVRFGRCRRIGAVEHHHASRFDQPGRPAGATPSAAILRARAAAGLL